MSIVQAYTEAYRNYLFDESRTMGRADYIAFPRNEAELVEAVRFARDNHVPLTAQGAQTLILGCTELPLAFARYDLAGYETLNPTEVLARAAIREAMGAPAGR